MNLLNYHVHTVLCGHATGTIDDYINAAIDKGISILGFADHAPLPLHLREGITMDPEELEFYINEIERRKEKYSGKIDIKLGLEIDFPVFETLEKKYFNDKRFDYFIGSCHFIDDWPFDHSDYRDEFNKRDINRVYKDYYSLIEALVDSRLFNIVGHFDVVKKFGHRADDDFFSMIEGISVKLAKYGTAVEINTSGLLKPVGEIYPSPEIIDIFFKNNVPVTIGSDAHSPELVDYGLADAISIIKKAGYRKISAFENRKRYEIVI